MALPTFLKKNEVLKNTNYLIAQKAGFLMEALYRSLEIYTQLITTPTKYYSKHLSCIKSLHKQLLLTIMTCPHLAQILCAR